MSEKSLDQEIEGDQGREKREDLVRGIKEDQGHYLDLGRDQDQGLGVRKGPDQERNVDQDPRGKDQDPEIKRIRNRGQTDQGLEKRRKIGVEDRGRDQAGRGISGGREVWKGNEIFPMARLIKQMAL